MDWRLPSNSGRDLTNWTISEQTTDHFLCNCEFRSEAVEETLPRASFRFSRLIVHKCTIAEFLKVADNWLNQPLSDAVSTPFETSFDVGSSFDNFLRLKFGTDESIISGQNFAARFDYHVAGVGGGFSYVVDQTCLREFAEGMRGTLRRMHS